MSKIRQFSVVVVSGVALVLVACSGGLPEGLRVEQQQAANLIERKAGQIVYVGPDGNIYVTDQGGIQQIAITTDATFGDFYHIYHTPVWSRDSSSLAFAAGSGLQGQAPSDSVIYTVSSEGGVLSETFYGNDITPYHLNWSPDGNYLTFLTTDATGRTFELRTIRLDGTMDPLLISSDSPVYASWSPNSQSMLAHFNPGSGTNGVLGQLSLGARAELEELPFSAAQFQAPAWSPDGRHMLFATSEDEELDSLVIANPDGTQPRVMARYSGNSAFGWSPNSRYVAYVTSPMNPATNIFDGTAIGPLRVFDTRRTNTRTLTEDPVLAFFWSPDNKWLAYFVPSFSTDEESDEQLLLVELRVVKRRGGNSRTLSTFQPSAQFLNVLSLFDQFQESATIWSPNNQFVVYSAAGNDTVPPTIAVMHVSGTLQPRVLRAGTVAFWSWE